MPPAPLTTPTNQFANPGGFARTSAFRPSSLLPVDQAGNKQMSLLQKGMDMARGPQGQGLLGALGSPTATAALAGALSTTTNPNLRGLAGALKGIADMDAAKTTARLRGSNDPAAVREFKYVQTLTKEQRDDYFNLKRRGDIVKEGSAVFRVNPDGSKTKLFDIDFQTEMLEKNKAQKQINKPNAIKLVQSSQQAYDIALENLNKAFDIIARDIKLVGGARQQISRYIGGTPARDLEKVLDVVKANIGFNKLQQMRSQSKTGGALGNVSNIELGLLQSVLGSVDATQKLRSLIPGLRDVYDNLVALKNQIHEHYETDGYGAIEPIGLAPNKTPTEPSRYPAAIAAYNKMIGQLSADEDGDNSEGEENLDEELAKKEKLWEAQPEKRKERFKTFINTETDPEKKQEKINTFIEKFGPNIFKQVFGS